jgi:hypothetical protein
MVGLKILARNRRMQALVAPALCLGVQFDIMYLLGECLFVINCKTAAQMSEVNYYTVL